MIISSFMQTTTFYYRKCRFVHFLFFLWLRVIVKGVRNDNVLYFIGFFSHLKVFPHANIYYNIYLPFSRNRGIYIHIIHSFAFVRKGIFSFPDRSYSAGVIDVYFPYSREQKKVPSIAVTFNILNLCDVFRRQSDLAKEEMKI